MGLSVCVCARMCIPMCVCRYAIDFYRKIEDDEINE